MTFNRKAALFVAGLVTGLTLSGAAQAQSESELVSALAGKWQIYDDLYAVDGNPCRITLDTSPADDGYSLQAENCGLELSNLTGWQISDGQLILRSGEDSVAVLGGNQLRMSGTSGIGAPVILDRIGEGVPANPIAAARQTSNCYYLGFTNTCADDAQLTKPTVPGDGSGARINVLVNLNARIEPRDNATVVGVVPANSCIVTDTCAKTADGVWCRANFGGQEAWLKKTALRQQTWPVVTFVNQCSVNDAPAPSTSE